jgi:membrane protease YdiL (CAAX protease family)
VDQLRGPSPIRATLFFSTCLINLILVGPAMLANLRLFGFVAQQVLIFTGLAVIFALFVDLRPLSVSIRFRMLTPLGIVKSALLGLLAWGLANSLGFLMVALITTLGGTIPRNYQMIMDAPFLTALAVGALTPAICEEIAFRGYLLGNLRPLGLKSAVILSGILFGAMHLSLIRFLPLTALGLLFGLAAYRVGSVLPSMIMHLVNNGTIIALSFYVGRASAETAATPPSIAGVVVHCIVALVLGFAAWSLANTFGPSDLAAQHDSDEEASAWAAPETPGRTKIERLLAVYLPLIPAALVYAWFAAYELVVVFGSK